MNENKRISVYRGIKSYGELSIQKTILILTLLFSFTTSANPLQYMLNNATIEQAQLLHKACISGEASACNILGVWYQEGTPNSVSKNVEYSFLYYKKACIIGHSKACSNANSVYVELSDQKQNQYVSENLQAATTGCTMYGNLISCDTVLVYMLASAKFSKENSKCAKRKALAEELLKFICHELKSSVDRNKVCKVRKAQLRNIYCKRLDF